MITVEGLRYLVSLQRKGKPIPPSARQDVINYLNLKEKAVQMHFHGSKREMYQRSVRKQEEGKELSKKFFAYLRKL